MHIHFVNLDRSTERLAAFKATNAHLTDVTRIRAIEESSIDLQSLTRQGLVKADILSMYPIGGLCRALSDLNFWNKTIEAGTPQTIADDDAIFNFNFESCAEEVIKGLPPDWDLVLWGFNFDMFMIFDMLPGVTPCVCQFDQAGMRVNTRNFQQMSILPRAHKLVWSFGMTSYTVSPKGAHFLKSNAFPLQPKLIACPEGMRTPPHSFHYRTVGIDNTINGLYKQMNAYVCVPPLVISTNDQTNSTIQLAGSNTIAMPSAEKSPVAAKQQDIAALSRQGAVFYTERRFEDALATFSKVVDLSPRTAEAHYNRATILADLDRLDEALDAYDRVIALKPNFAFAFNNRGWVLQRLKRYEEALKCYDQALAIDSSYTAAKDNRELLLRAQTAEATHDLQQPQK